MNWSCVDYLALCFQKAPTQCFDCKGLLEISWGDTKLWPAWSGSTDPAQQLPPWARRWVAEYFCNHIHNLQGLSRSLMIWWCARTKMLSGSLMTLCLRGLCLANWWHSLLTRSGQTLPREARSDAWQLCQTSSLFHLRWIWGNIPEISTILRIIHFKSRMNNYIGEAN